MPPTSPSKPAHYGAGASIVAARKACPPEIVGYVRFGNCCEFRLYLKASSDLEMTKEKVPVLLLVAVGFVLLICGIGVT